MVVAIAAVAVGVSTPAGAVSTSCTKPFVVAGQKTVGISLDVTTPTAPTAAVCIHPDNTQRFEIGGSPAVYAYGTSGAIGGAYGYLCWHEGSTYTCAQAGGVGGAFNSAPWGDAVSVFLIPSVCEHHSSYTFQHCFAVFLFGGADGPVFGPLGGAGGGVFVCEDTGYWFYCPVMLSEWVP
ncbi:MAG TPA: hypothetical protein VM938_04995 [Acidimicrobiales bacterium]|nr:hypothetical protein [Acidimicrobiales bacterium]